MMLAMTVEVMFGMAVEEWESMLSRYLRALVTTVTTVIPIPPRHFKHDPHQNSHHIFWIDNKQIKHNACGLEREVRT